MTPIEVVQAIYAAMATKDIEQLTQLIHPECVLTQDERLPWGGRFVGHDGFVTFALALTGAIESAVATDEMFEADGDVIQVGHTRGTLVGTGTPFDVAEIHRWTIADGTAIRAHFSIDTPGMLAALATR